MESVGQIDQQETINGSKFPQNEGIKTTAQAMAKVSQGRDL